MSGRRHQEKMHSFFGDEPSNISDNWWGKPQAFPGIVCVPRAETVCVHAKGGEDVDGLTESALQEHGSRWFASRDGSGSGAVDDFLAGLVQMAPPAEERMLLIDVLPSHEDQRY